MNDFHLSPDDPQLTAYALGELEGDERAAVDAAIRRDPALRQAVEEIRATVARLEDALAAEAAQDTFRQGAEVPQVPELANAAGSASPQRAGGQRNGTSAPPYGRPRGKLLRFPQLYFLVSGAAAAGFAVLIAVREPMGTRAPAPTVERQVAASAPRDESVRDAGAETLIVALPSAPAARAAAADTPSTPPRVEKVTAVAPPPVAESAVLPAGSGPAPATVPEFNFTAPALGSLTLATDAAAFGPGGGARPPGTLRIGPEGESAREFAPAASHTAAGVKQERGPMTVRSEASDSRGWAEVQSRAASVADADRAPATAAALAPSGIAAPATFAAPAPDSERGRAREAPAADNVALPPYRFPTGFVAAAAAPIVPVPVQVETTGYATLRRLLQLRRLPPADAVRIEELLNSFAYRYPTPAVTEPEPFAVSLEVAEAPWARAHRLVRIGIHAPELGAARVAQRPVSTQPEPARLVAENVQLEVQFNPARVAQYRIIGYNSRSAGEARLAETLAGSAIHSGHTATVLYEIVLADGGARAAADQLLAVNVRYTVPGSSVLQRRQLLLPDVGLRFEAASADFQFAAAVAAFGMLLRDAPEKRSMSFREVAGWASTATARSAGELQPQRGEFVELVRTAQALSRAE